MNSCRIEYIDPDEDMLQKEADWALSVSMEERFKAYCQHIYTNYLLAGIDVAGSGYPGKRIKYYIEDHNEF